MYLGRDCHNISVLVLSVQALWFYFQCIVIYLNSWKKHFSAMQNAAFCLRGLCSIWTWCRKRRWKVERMKGKTEDRCETVIQAHLLNFSYAVDTHTLTQQYTLHSSVCRLCVQLIPYVCHWSCVYLWIVCYLTCDWARVLGLWVMDFGRQRWLQSSICMCDNEWRQM